MRFMDLSRQLEELKAMVARLAPPGQISTTSA